MLYSVVYVCIGPLYVAAQFIKIRIVHHVRCEDCPDAIGYDLCGVCHDVGPRGRGRFNQNHRPDHRMVKVPPELLEAGLAGAGSHIGFLNIFKARERYHASPRVRCM